jgi:membrane-bound ClpP family serine protease
MAEYDADRPFLIAVLAPLLCLLGFLGTLYALSHLGFVKGVPELDALLQFIHQLVSSRGINDVRTLSFVSLIFLFGGSGLWSMKRWGAVLTIIGAVLVGYHAYTSHGGSGLIMAACSGVAIIVFFHFKEFQ